jgi:L-threonylcarbamoyladenylate synthase
VVNSFGNFSRRRGEWAPSKLQGWQDALFRGEVVAAPAEGVYGYCCSPFNERAIGHVLSLKNRSSAKGLIVLCRNIADVRRVADLEGDYKDDIIRAMNRHWPGAVTLILPASPAVSGILTGFRDTIAVRIPEELYMHEYLEKWKNPLVSTSLNLTGKPAIRRGERIPHGVVSLTMEHRLSGETSRIFNVITGEWLR